MIPSWPPGTVCVLGTVGDDGPHAIPVSAAVRASDERVLLGLARGRGSLARLRARPDVTLAVLAPGVAVTLQGRASVVAERLPGAEAVAAVALDVVRVHDHGRPSFVVEAGAAWRWTDEEARRRDAATRAALEALARGRA